MDNHNSKLVENQTQDELPEAKSKVSLKIANPKLNLLQFLFIYRLCRKEYSLDVDQKVLEKQEMTSRWQKEKDWILTRDEQRHKATGKPRLMIDFEDEKTI